MNKFKHILLQALKKQDDSGQNKLRARPASSPLLFPRPPLGSETLTLPTGCIQPSCREEHPCVCVCVCCVSRLLYVFTEFMLTCHTLVTFSSFFLKKTTNVCQRRLPSNLCYRDVSPTCQSRGKVHLQKWHREVLCCVVLLFSNTVIQP